MELERHVALLEYTVEHADKRKRLSKQDAEKMIATILGEHADDLPKDWRSKAKAPA